MSREDNYDRAVGPLVDGKPRRPPEAGDAMLSGLLGAAIAAHQQWQLDEAETAYRLILDKFPRQPDALQLLGVLHFLKGDHVEAVKLLRRAVRVAPKHDGAHDNLARVLRETGNPKAALAHHRARLTLAAPSTAPLENFAKTLEALCRFDEATKAVADALALDPENGKLHQYHGLLLARSGRYDDAIIAFARALAQGEQRANTYLANLLAAVGDDERVREGLRRWRDAAPDDPIARHLQSAFATDAAPERASDDYVRETFNSFAATFDTKLHKLGYRVPDLLRALLLTRLGDGTADRDVTDLGCGTGLCSEFLRTYARRLVGVDISANMLEGARQRQHYDALVEAELTAFLAANADAFDLAVAGDVFCYFGELDAVIAGVFGASRPGALFAFTVEAEPGHSDYLLQYHGRYRHAATYVRHTLEAAGFVDISIGYETLRRERGEDVRGLLVDARRP